MADIPQQLDHENEKQVKQNIAMDSNGSENNNSVDSAQVQEIEKLTEKMNIYEQKNQAQDKQQKNQGQQQLSVESPQKSEELTELNETKDFININRTSIIFGKTTLFPGSIEEVDVTIELKDDIAQQDQQRNPFMLRVIAKCSNPQFNDLDEYVFSVRSNERFQYFEEVRFKIRRREKAQVKVAVKIPPIKGNYVIEGNLQVQLEGLQPIQYPIIAKCEVPKIICLKDLFKTDENTQIIKIPGKKNQMRMPPIPFKNLSNFNFTLQIEAISNQSFHNKPYDIITQNFISCQANTQFFVNIQLKENMTYNGPVPSRYVIRKILVLKIKNSSVYFNFPIQVYVFEGSHAGGMN